MLVPSVCAAEYAASLIATRVLPLMSEHAHGDGLGFRQVGGRNGCFGRRGDARGCGGEGHHRRDGGHDGLRWLDCHCCSFPRFPTRLPSSRLLSRIVLAGVDLALSPVLMRRAGDISLFFGNLSEKMQGPMPSLHVTVSDPCSSVSRFPSAVRRAGWRASAAG